MIVDTVCKPIAGVSSRLTIRRHIAGFAYPANGNVHNPTPRYRFLLFVDDVMVDSDNSERVLRRAAKDNEVDYLTEVDAR